MVAPDLITHSRQSVQLKLKVPWALLLSFVVVVQIAFLVLLPSSARGIDSKDYFEFYSPVAQNLLAGRGLVLNSGEFGSTYPPAFPLFLAGEYFSADLLHLDRITFILLINVVLMSIACIAIVSTASKLFDSKVGMCSAILWITYFPNLWLIKQPTTEVLFIPLLYSGIYYMIRAWKDRDAKSAATCGVLLGIGALVRPLIVALPLLLAAFLLTRAELERRKRRLMAVLLASGFVIAILPWEAELYVHTHHIYPLSTNGPSSILDGLTFTRRSNVHGIPAPVAQLMQRITASQRQLKTSGRIFACLMGEAKRHPGAVAELVLLKMARSWFGTDSGSRERFTLLVQLVYLTLTAAGFVFVSRQQPDKRPYLVLFLVVALYFWGMAVVALSILRYLVPAIAYLLIPAGALIVSGSTRARLTRVTD